MKIANARTYRLPALALAMLAFGIANSNAQTELLAIEFNDDDQEGFDLWPSALAGAESIAEFATDAGVTSGTTTVKISTNTGLSVPVNRGDLVDGTPEGFTYAGLYQDLLHASTPTGALTFDFSGLRPSTLYRFTLYAWDPGAIDTSDKVWTVSEGSSEPTVASVNFQDTLVDNETFGLVFEITTTASGSFQVTNTAGLPQSAVNGFRLEALEAPGPFKISAVDYSPGDSQLTLTWDSVEGESYAVKFSRDMTDWKSDLNDGVEAGVGDSTTEAFDLKLAGLEGATRVYFRIEKL